MEDWSALGVSDGEGMRVARPRRGAPGYSHWGRAPAGEVRVRARVRVSGEGEGVSGEGEGEGERGVSVRREGEGGACSALTPQRHLHGACGQLAAGIGSAGGGVAVAMHGWGLGHA